MEMFESRKTTYKYGVMCLKFLSQIFNLICVQQSNRLTINYERMVIKKYFLL